MNQVERQAEEILESREAAWQRQKERYSQSQNRGQVLVQPTSLSLAWVELLQTPAACLLLCSAVLFAAVVVVVVVVLMLIVASAAIADLLPLNGSSISGSLSACFHFHLLYCICVWVSLFMGACTCVSFVLRLTNSHSYWIVIESLIINIASGGWSVKIFRHHMVDVW